MTIELSRELLRRWRLSELPPGFPEPIADGMFDAVEVENWLALELRELGLSLDNIGRL